MGPHDVFFLDFFFEAVRLRSALFPGIGIFFFRAMLFFRAISILPE